MACCGKAISAGLIQSNDPEMLCSPWHIRTAEQKHFSRWSSTPVDVFLLVRFAVQLMGYAEVNHHHIKHELENSLIS